MGTALSTTDTPCLIGVAISPLKPNAPHLVMGSSAEENDGVRVRGAQCVYGGGAHCISRRICVCVRLSVCVCARAHVCERVCEYLRGFVVCRCVNSVCVCMHARVQMLVCMPVCINVCVCVYACMFLCVFMCSCVYAGNRV